MWSKFHSSLQEPDDVVSAVHKYKVVFVKVVEYGRIHPKLLQLFALASHPFRGVVFVAADEVHLAWHFTQTLQVARDGSDALEPLGVGRVHGRDNGRTAI